MILRRRQGDGTNIDRHIPDDLVAHRRGRLEARWPDPTAQSVADVLGFTTEAMAGSAPVVPRIAPWDGPPHRRRLLIPPDTDQTNHNGVQ